MEQSIWSAQIQPKTLEIVFQSDLDQYLLGDSLKAHGSNSMDMRVAKR